jgi:hypothetical protein
MKHFLQQLLVLIYLFVAIQTSGQLRFNANISPAVIGVDEYANLELVVENANQLEQIIPPSFKNFKVISGPIQTNGISTINGLVKKYSSISFTLQPKSIGKFNFDAATARADGKVLHSNSVQLQVVKRTARKIIMRVFSLQTLAA